jgi:hypothetical protein
MSRDNPFGPPEPIDNPLFALISIETLCRELLVGRRSNGLLVLPLRSSPRHFVRIAAQCISAARNYFERSRVGPGA